MSGFSLFGKKKADTNAPSPAIAIKKIRDTLDTLDKREQHLRTKATTADNHARELMKKKDKNGALMSLRRKKLLENEINKINGSRINLERQILSLENMAMTMDTFNAYKEASNAMAGVRKGID